MLGNKPPSRSNSSCLTCMSDQKSATPIGFSARGGSSAPGGSGRAPGAIATEHRSGIVPSAGSAFGSGTNSVFGQPTTFGAAPATTHGSPSPVMTGTASQVYSVFRERDPSNARIDLKYVSISAMPAYQGTSLEELRVQDYEQGRNSATSVRKNPEIPVMQTPGFFETTMTAEEPTKSATASSGLGGEQQLTGNGGAASSFSETDTVRSGSTHEQTIDPVIHPAKLERIEELLRKSLLGEELVDTQFHLFSARSSSSGRVTKPRVVCTSNVLLAKSSKYFLDLLGSDTSPSDASLIDLTGDIPSSGRISDYGYESDSDLDEFDDSVPLANFKAPKDRSPTSSSKPGTDESFCEDGDKSRSVTAVRQRSAGSRHVLVKDTAFQTWYTLLNYLYTGKFGFLPLRSTPSGANYKSSMGPRDGPRCSAKSMYRLASKVGLNHLRDEAFYYIRNNLTEHNILKEISCSLVPKYPQLLEIELDVLYFHITSPMVVANFSTLARQIANKELPHGADIVIGIHARLLKERHPLSLKSVVPTSPPAFFGPPKPEEPTVSTREVSSAGAQQDETRLHPFASGKREGSLSVLIQGSVTVVEAAIPINEPNVGGKDK